MPNRKRRERRRQGGLRMILPTLIVLTALAAAALVFVLINSDPLAPERTGSLPYNYSDPINFVENVSYAPLVLGNTPTPAPTEDVPDAEDTQSAPNEDQTAKPDGEDLPAVEGMYLSDNRLVPTPQPGDYFLPVFDKALRTPNDRAMIAITVDNCDDAEVMTRILSIARVYGAELTLFPTGDALMKLSEGFRTCVSVLDYELENSCYDSSKRDYSLSSGELALQIWRQSIAASYAMTKDYQQHFYRPKVKESAGDQRTHFFIRKLGFYGIASYTHSYKDFNNVESLVATLENGNIYQFDMTEKSMAIMETFMNEASRKGYKMVTMNELFGLDDNKVEKTLTLDQQVLPEMNDYVPTYYDLKLNDRTNAVYSLQARLMNLGYLVADPNAETELRADGIYGAATSVAVSAFQAKVGLVATGKADAETQRKLFAQDAPAAN